MAKSLHVLRRVCEGFFGLDLFIESHLALLGHQFLTFHPDKQ